MRFSRRTLVALSRVVAEIHTHTDIDTLAYELQLETKAIGSNKQARSLALVRAVECRCEDMQSDREMADLVQSTLLQITDWQAGQPVVTGLIASLQIDGLEIRDGRLLPTTPGPATLAPEVSGLEFDLEAAGLGVAATHYRQANDNLAQGNFEAANGQVRSFLENLLISICRLTSGRTFSDAGAALKHMRQSAFLDASEFNSTRGFWDASHTNGPHHGLSNQDEALFRLHVATAIGRYVLRKLAARATV